MEGESGEREGPRCSLYLSPFFLFLIGEVRTVVSSYEELGSPVGIVMNHKENSFFITCPETNKILKVTSAGELPTHPPSSFPSPCLS